MNNIQLQHWWSRRCINVFWQLVSRWSVATKFFWAERRWNSSMQSMLAASSIIVLWHSCTGKLFSSIPTFKNPRSKDNHSWVAINVKSNHNSLRLHSFRNLNYMIPHNYIKTNLTDVFTDYILFYSGPVQAYILAHPDAVQRWREVMGPTKTFRAQYEAPDTLRGSFGLTDTRNLCHGSDSHDSAVREISFFFPEFSVEQWQQWDEPFYRRGESKLDEETFTHLIEKNNHVGPQCNSQ